eukprot:4841153-Amphidinium_carterae.1
MMPRSYIIAYMRFHPTTGYHQATPEIREFYDGFKIYNFDDKFNPNKPQRGRDEVYNATAATINQRQLSTRLLQHKEATEDGLPTREGSTKNKYNIEKQSYNERKSWSST